MNQRCALRGWVGHSPVYTSMPPSKKQRADDCDAKSFLRRNRQADAVPPMRLPPLLVRWRSVAMLELRSPVMSRHGPRPELRGSNAKPRNNFAIPVALLYLGPANGTRTPSSVGPPDIYPDPLALSTHRIRSPMDCTAAL